MRQNKKVLMSHFKSNKAYDMYTIIHDLVGNQMENESMFVLKSNFFSFVSRLYV